MTYDVSTIADARTSLDGMLEWTWGGQSSYEGAVAYVRQHASADRIDGSERDRLIAAYLASRGEDPTRYGLPATGDEEDAATTGDWSLVETQHLAHVRGLAALAAVRDEHGEALIDSPADLRRSLASGHLDGPTHRLADESPVLIVGIWVADDGNQDVEYPEAGSADEAARAYVEDGSWGDVTDTTWVSVYVWQRAYGYDDDGELVELTWDRQRHSITLDPEEPDCTEAAHDWRSPHSVVGGIRENPGVWAHGGGVVIREVCAHCGRYRVVDTWAQDPETGEQGLTSTTYEDADEDSASWVERREAERLLRDD